MQVKYVMTVGSDDLFMERLIKALGKRSMDRWVWLGVGYKRVCLGTTMNVVR